MKPAAALCVMLFFVSRSDVTAQSCEGCVTARYWIVPPITSSEAFVYPELDPASPSAEVQRLRQLPNVGVAFSGGGTRSASAVLGQLRGLHHNGWLQNVRYISTVSGGAWASIPFVYSKVHIDNLLGRFESPGELRLDALQAKPNGLLAKQIAGASLTAGSFREATEIVALLKGQQAQAGADRLLRYSRQFALGLRRDKDRLSKTYSHLLADIFIDPLIQPGSSASKRPFAWDANSAANTGPASDGSVTNPVLATLNRPYLVASGTMVSNRRDYAEPLLMQVEYTPLYSGVPALSGAGRFGGNYVSSWAYDALRVGAKTPPSGTAPGTVDVVPNPQSFTLADVAASSGAAPEIWLVNGGGSSLPSALKPLQAKLTFGAGFFPAFRHLSLNGAEGVVSREIPHADGGGGDNLGVMPLLARQVKNVLVFINTSTQHPEDNTDLRSLFIGGATSASGSKAFNKVFEESRYQEVVNGLRSAADDDKTLVYCNPQTWKVLDNDHYNVRGFEGLSICFFYNARAPEWEQALNDQLLEWLKAERRAWFNPKRWFGHGVRHETRDVYLTREKSFRGFPWYSTFFQDKPHFIKLSRLEVNLLSNLTAWTVTEPRVKAQVLERMPDIARSDAAR